ncbi:hypothetical protein [Methanosarcina mazei]|uniref:Uncharacterized protein n=1 Tax=Methanosarcina mazei TaxID=2209 RepID=A0A0F8NDC1_METMZ|nr:hypothetical protein [Methanosarcina mazei]KKH38975.1 hypothetical protein DU71_01325 [Methanosarcina mazei]KKH56865.1 hypothetical protein DU72_01665 [Methanosarcina mazei]QIB91273.1 hypothetical protein FQU78_09680 [Methanosarcina mazei]
MKCNKSEISAIFTAIILVSIAFVPAVSAQSDKILTSESSGEITVKSTVSVLGEEACDLLTAALWTLDQYINDSRISTAETKLSKGASAFRNSQITTGFNYLKQGTVISFNLATDWAPSLLTWVYNKLVSAANSAKSLLTQYGYW